MATKHFCVFWKLKGDVHCCKHLRSSSFKKSTTTPNENRITCENGSVDSSNNPILVLFLNFGLDVRSLFGVKIVQNMTFRVARSMETLDTHLIIKNRQQLLIRNRNTTPRNVVKCSTMDSNVWILFLQSFVRSRVVPVFVRCKYVCNVSSEIEILLKSFNFVKLSGVYVDPLIDVLLMIDIVTKVVLMHWNHDYV